MLKKLLIKSLDAGADAVKFQIYFADELLAQNHPRFYILKNNHLMKLNGQS